MNDRSKTTIVPVRQTAEHTPAASGAAMHGGPQGRRRWILAGFGLLAATVVGLGFYLLSRTEAETPGGETEFAAFRGHAAPVVALALSADGETVVSGDESGKMLVWNAATREPRIELPEHPRGVRCLAVSLDGEAAATGDEQGTIRIWDLPRRKLQQEFPAHGGGVAGVLLYPTKQIVVSAGGDGRIALWDVAAPKLLAECAAGEGEITCLAAGHDFLRLVSGDATGRLRLWELATLTELHHFDGHRGRVTALAVSPRGDQAISSGDDGVLRRWDLEGRRDRGTLPTDDAHPASSVAVSAGGTRALTISSRGGRLWSLDDGRLIQSYDGPDAPAACAAFYPAGTFFLAGSGDPAVRLWRTPPPSQTELKQATEIAEATTATAAKLRRFGEQMALAKQMLDGGREKEALRELESAGAGVPRNSLEFRLARDAATDLHRNMTALERYARLCDEGKRSLDQEDFAAAIRSFGEAEDAVRGLAFASERSEARDGLKAAVRLQRLKQALDGLKVTDQSLDFAAYAGPRPLDRGREFAFLLVKETPPIALADTALEWTAELESASEFPEEKAVLRVELRDEKSGELQTSDERPFQPGVKTQTFLGSLAPPPTGWRPGAYELRSVLVVGDKKIEQGKKFFKIGRLNWTETRFELAPQAVQEAGYVVAPGVNIERGDALSVTAQGTIRPAPLAFYREILVSPNLSAPVPSPPAGLPWKLSHLRFEKYRMVDMKADFAALVLRIGYEGTWVPYKPGVPPLLMPAAGPLHASINSVMPKDFSHAGKNRPPTAAEKSYWAADCGSYQVVVRHGKFDFPVPLSELERVGLLLRYFSESDVAPSP